MGSIVRLRACIDTMRRASCRNDGQPLRGPEA